MLEALAIIAVIALVAVIAVAAAVLAIARAVKRWERKLGRAARGPSRRPGRRATQPKPSRTPRPAKPTFRIPPVLQPRPEMRWNPPGSTLRIHELAIAAPMAYVAVDRRPSQNPLDPSEIIASLPVSARGVAAPAPDWPSYARLSPEQRFAYLSWLADDRRALPRDESWAMLHLMGLERRALVDGADLGPVVQEVCRVRELVAAEIAREDGPGAAGNAEPAARRWAAYMRQTGSLLWTLVALRPDEFSERDLRILASRTSSWSQEALAAAMAWCIRRNAAAAPAWLAMVAAENAPGARRSVVIDRIPDKFSALFEKRLTEKHARGPALRTAKRERTLAYRPANDTIRAVEARIPDALGIPSQFTPLVELWNACIDDLRPLARVADTTAGDDTPMTLARWQAMPADLRAGLDNPFAPALAALAAAHPDDSGHAIVPIGSLALALRMDAGERAALTPTQSRELAAAIEGAGMAIEPDARITDAAYRRDDHACLLPAPIPIDYSAEARARYLAAACVLRLGAAVALVDGQASERELEPIALELERAFDLSEDQHRRIDALLNLLRARGSNVKAVGKRLLAALSPDTRRTVGTLLVAVAAADGQIADAERAMLRTCYRALGLEPGDLDSALATLAAPLDHEPAPTPTLQLDRDAIGRIMQETREVAQLLADAMRAEPDGEPSEQTAEPPGEAPANAPSPAPEPPAGAAPTPEGMNPRYAPFYHAIIARESWSLDQAAALAREHRLMLAGAVEMVNDWSYERTQGPLLIDDGERLIVDPDRRRMLN